MRILMFTNSYRPAAGGASDSIRRLGAALRRRGHEVRIAAAREHAAPEPGLLRVPGGAGEAVPAALERLVGEFRPQVLHAHHSTGLGELALRLGERHELPVVFSLHPSPEGPPSADGSTQLRRLAQELAAGYAGLCDATITATEAAAAALRRRGLDRPVERIPTAVDFMGLARGDGRAARERLGIDPNAQLIGHVGRLTPDRDPVFLAEAVADFLAHRPSAHFVCVGEGPAAVEMRRILVAKGVAHRTHFTGALQRLPLADLYRALDVFAFASPAPGRGLALAEAMAAGVPVVAVDAPEVAELVEDRRNGRLVEPRHPNAFVAALDWVLRQPPARRGELGQAARQAARGWAEEACAERTLALYQRVVADHQPQLTAAAGPQGEWELDWSLLSQVGRAARNALQAVRVGG